VILFDRDGRFISSWGEGLFVRPHGITIGPDDSVYCTDDLDHTVRKFTPEGRLVFTLGVSGRPADTGIDGIDYRTIRRVGPPFHRPANLAVAPDGTLLVADGYGNARIHRFSAEGKLLEAWGQPGSGAGQFNLPHGIVTDRRGRVYVADRENSRVQIFTPEGKFIEEWTDLARPMEIFIDRDENVFVAEVGWFAATFPWHVLPPNAARARISIFDLAGRLKARWGGDADPLSPGFLAPHDLWIDRFGDIYIGEVISWAAGDTTRVPQNFPVLKKLRRANS
jgi:streptogramin lyase